MNIKSLQIRENFLTFFQKKGCTIMHSASLVPNHDPTLLFTSAGMVPFKNYFLHSATKYKRVTSCQKCIRTSDIEQVGRTIRHLTFFEMLGNFSFGDYFKQEAIVWAWEFLTKNLCLPSKKLYVTVYHNDDEAFNIWKKLLNASSKIIKLGKTNNFWDMGTTGPCGPCSEILIDLGDHIGCRQASCNPQCECGRYLELWNLVFTQFNKKQDGILVDLPQKNIDTGMGLERIVAVCNNQNDVFNTDLFKPIMQYIIDILDIKKNNIPLSNIKIIADHIRAIVFLITDGVLPLNEGRGYVLRKIIRLAAKQGYNIGYKKPFLYKFVNIIVDIMSPIYPELIVNSKIVESIIIQEEEKFLATLMSGSKMLDNIISSYKTSRKTIVPGKDIFKLYDTYGFPADLTKEILNQHSLKFDETGFKLMQDTAKKQASYKLNSIIDKNNFNYLNILSNGIQATTFLGYSNYQTYGKVVALMKNNVKTNVLNVGDYGLAILTKTSFYSQGGGQVGDIGYIIGESCECKVTDVFCIANKIVIHKIHIIKGILKINDTVLTKIDQQHRLYISMNHTTTHILNYVLRKYFGDHIHQAGSAITTKKFHFDFTHFSPLTKSCLNQIENMVNSIIRSNLQIYIKNMHKDAAYSIGAISLSSKVYANIVRTVIIKGEVHNSNNTMDQICSIELCAGTHVQRTGDIGIFKITATSSASNGIRRIEGVTGAVAEKYICSEEEIISEACKELHVMKHNFLIKLKNYVSDYTKMQNNINSLHNKMIKNYINLNISKIKNIAGTKYLPILVDDFNIDMLRFMLRELEIRLKSIIILLVSQTHAKVIFLVLVSKDYIEQGFNARDIAKKFAVDINGYSGGTASFAQGGSKFTYNMKDTLNHLEKYITN
ncbi:MAG: alanine--tRNA ligase [Endomicrobium sp.]|jgi:alanyl-tRNA synthetase|nr:alanine--tRNA ligase [Endomicrobium sp.]